MTKPDRPEESQAMTHADRDRTEPPYVCKHGKTSATHWCDDHVDHLARLIVPQTPASDATCPPDATETPADTRAGVDTAEDRTEAQGGCADPGCHAVSCDAELDADSLRALRAASETDAGGMDNQGAELDRLRVSREVLDVQVDAAIARAKAAEAEAARLRELLRQETRTAIQATERREQHAATIARVESICRNTDGEWLDADVEVPVGVVLRMLFTEGGV